MQRENNGSFKLAGHSEVLKNTLTGRYARRRRSLSLRNDFSHSGTTAASHLSLSFRTAVRVDFLLEVMQEVRVSIYDCDDWDQV